MPSKLKYIFILLLALSFKVTIGQSDKVEAMKVSFITKEISLTPAEAQSFWPLYNEYNDKVKSLRKNFKANYGSKEDFKNDKDAEDFLNAEIKLKQTEVDLRKEYVEKFKKVIGSRKTAQLRKAEEKFIEIVLNTAKGKSP